MGGHAFCPDFGCIGSNIRLKINSERSKGHREERCELQCVLRRSWIFDDFFGTRSTSTDRFSILSLLCSKRRWNVVVEEGIQSHWLYIVSTLYNMLVREGVVYIWLVAISLRYDKSSVRHFCSSLEGVELSHIYKRSKSDRRRTVWARQWPSHGYLRVHINEENISYVGRKWSDAVETPREGNFENLRREVPSWAYFRCWRQKRHGGGRRICRRRDLKCIFWNQWRRKWHLLFTE